MYDIDKCCKFIFEAMLKDDMLEYIATKVYEYTKADCFFVSGSGEILAYSCAKTEFVSEEGHITLEDYENFLSGKKRSGKNNHIAVVDIRKRILGYIVFIYADLENKSFFQELGEILSQATISSFEENQKNCIINLSLKERITGWSLFRKENFHKQNLSDILEEKYIVALFSKESVMLEKFLPKITSVWMTYFLYEESNYIAVLFFRLNSKDAEGIYTKLMSMKAKCCISELFSDIDLCRSKLEFLKRMMNVQESDPAHEMKREKDWYIQGIFTHTVPLIEEAGLSDYSILRLIQEDEKNNTELYDTLKMYLLCENNITVAAEKLHIHRNTLVYRLRQIKDCIEVDINDNEISRELLAFLMMYDISKRTED